MIGHEICPECRYVHCFIRIVPSSQAYRQVHVGGCLLSLEGVQMKHYCPRCNKKWEVKQ